MARKNQEKPTERPSGGRMPHSMLVGAAILVVVALGAFFLFFSKPAEVAPGKFDAFAKCLADHNVTMFGAFWCPHCNSEKKAFGDSFQFMHYVECSEPDGTTQTPACKAAQIEGYPTWQFADGTRIPGEVPMASLAQKTGCALPA